MGSDWVKFFSVKFVSIESLRGSVFRFLQGSPGCVFCKTSSDAEETPEKITSSALSYERQAYLHSRIRTFVSNPWKDITRPPVGMNKNYMYVSNFNNVNW